VSDARGALGRGEVVELVIEKGVYRGRGLGRLGGRVVFVPRTHAGDRVRARVVEVHAGWAEAQLVEVLAGAPSRREAPCPYASLCGGCAYQELEKGEQLRVKESVLRESLARAGVPHEGELAVHASPEQGWRMRASLHFELAGDSLRLGLRQEGTRRVVDVESCLQLSSRMNQAARELRAALAGRPALVRQLKGLDLLESPEGDALVASLDTTLRPQDARQLASLGRESALVTGFGVRCGERLVWLHGAPHVEAQVLGLTLRTHVQSFFQGNRFLLEALAREVCALVPRAGGQVLDLYSGVGLFALPLAAREECDVIAVELAPRAAQDARANAERAGLARVRVVTEDVAQALAALPRGTGERVLLDPPRTGAGPDVVDLVADREPVAIVYVSCDPPTLGRDLARFAARGYRADSIALFDLFPDTFHMETVVRLIRTS
jgi:23S rRNA (uracil1939-C5)-methyltransferase